MFQESRFSTDGVVLNVARGPANGPPLAVLHGVTRRWTDFLPLLPALATRWHVYGIDFRGHGNSARVQNGYRVIDYVGDIVGWLETEAAQPAVLYGHSLGAMVAAAAAARSPQRVRALVLEDPPFDTLASGIRETQFYDLFHGFRELARRERSVPQLAKALAELRVGVAGRPEKVRLGELRDAASLRFSAKSLTLVDPECLTPLLEGRWLDGYDRPSILSRIACPVLLLQGNHQMGGMLPDVDADLTAGALADCTLVRFPKTGHNIHWYDPAGTLSAVMGFLEGV